MGGIFNAQFSYGNLIEFSIFGRVTLVLLNSEAIYFRLERVINSDEETTV